MKRSRRKSYPTSFKMRFSNNFKKKMAEQKLSQAKVARAMGVSRTSVSYWAGEKTIPSGENLKKLAQLLETSPRRMLGYTLGCGISEDIWANFLER